MSEEETYTISQDRAKRYEKALRFITEALAPNLAGVDYDPADCAVRCVRELVEDQVKQLAVSKFRQSETLHEQVLAFHKAGNHCINTKPTIPPQKVLISRGKLIAEEVFELLRAMFPENGGYLSNAEVTINQLWFDLEVGAIPPSTPDIVEVADGAGDLDYVVEGCRINFGFDGKPVGDEIHRTNMAKFGSGAWTDENGKTRKPLNWKPPDIEAELIKQGWTS
jgi:predicted HAD superfamily Cof-like phosphohydrolase